MDDAIPILVISGVIVITLVSTVTSAIRRHLNHRQTEQSRREIAAYVAEGSMTPDDAVRLLKASPKAERNE